MQPVIKPVVRTLVLYLMSLFMVALVLVAGTFAYDAVRDMHASRTDLETLHRVHADVARYRERQGADLTARLDAAPRYTRAALDRRIGVLAHELRTNLAPADIDPYALLRTAPSQYAERLASHFETALARELAAQELAYLQQLRGQLMMVEGRAAAQRELARLHGVHIAIDRDYREKQRQKDELGPLDRGLIHFGLPKTAKLEQLLHDVAALRIDEQRAAAACGAQRAALERMALPTRPGPFSLDQGVLARVVQPLGELVREREGAVASHPMSRMSDRWPWALSVAAGLLLAALVLKIALRAFLYFVLAPLATRHAPLRLASPGQPVADTAELISPSAASQTVRLHPHEELLVLPRYLHGAAAAAATTTRWLLRGRWWSSLASGMALLTCVRTRGQDEPVVLSAAGGGVGELALIRVPAQSNLVFQPRALVGVVCARDAPPEVEQHWRLGSLHAWLTLQLRFFVIRGPVTLVLQGRRGVRVRQAGGGQLVRDSATLAFSTGVAYSTQRSAPFLPYLQGQADLLYDRFEGGHGIYVHDETLDAAGAGGRLKRGLEGLGDGVMKVFGL